MMGEGSKPTSWADRWSVLAKENETLYKQLAAVRELPGNWREEWNEIENPYDGVRGKLECADELEAALNGEDDG